MNIIGMLSRSPISFSQGWEDYRVIDEGLEIKKGDILGSIVASGDNVLNLLLLEPQKIYAFDISINQIHELKLKLTAIKHLSHQEFLTLLGYKGNKKEHLKNFYKIIDKLEPETAIFWKKNKKMIYKGLAFQGRWEIFASLWKYPQKFFFGKDYYRLTQSEDTDERREIFQKRIDRPGIKFLVRIFFKKPIHRVLDMDRKIKKEIDYDYDHYSKLWKFLYHYFVDTPCKGNQYHYWLFTGEMPEDHKLWQPYLQEENYELLKNNLNKVTIIYNDFLSGLKSFEDNSFDKFYLSDVFEWMTFKDMEINLFEIIRVTKKNGKLIFLTFGRDRGIPQNVQKYVKFDPVRNKNLWEKERYGYYTNVYLLDVIK